MLELKRALDARGHCLLEVGKGLTGGRGATVTTGGRGTGCKFNSSLVNHLGMFKWAKAKYHHAAVHHHPSFVPTHYSRRATPCPDDADAYRHMQDHHTAVPHHPLPLFTRSLPTLFPDGTDA